jgi:predicted kinase
MTTSPDQEAPLLIVVTGPVATGKTTISKRLAHALGWPLINRDSIKEILFDTLGWHDRAWSKTLGVTSYHLLYYCLDLLLSTRHSCIVESNFDASFDSAKLQTLMHKHHVRSLQILCRCDPAVLVERFRQRMITGERHPGHVDHIEATKLDATQIRGWSEALALEGEHIALDTSNPESIDYATLLAQIQPKHVQR